jgi:integrase
MARQTIGIRQRHGRKCRGGRCSCPWEAWVYSKKDGKKIYKAWPTRAAAVKWREDAKPQVRKKLLRAPTSTTLNEAAKQWLAEARVGVIRPRSGEPYKPAAIRGYERHLRLRILPEIGSHRLSEIEREDVQKLVNTMLAQGMSAALIEASIVPLQAIYRHALDTPSMGIAVNPTTKIKLPANNGKRERVAPPQECQALLAALPRVGDRALWATAMYAGLRRGELQALRIEDVDLAAGLIYVRRGWDQYDGEITPKSGKERKVPIAAALRTHLAAHLLALGRRDGLVFGTTRADPFSPSSIEWRANRAWGWERHKNPDTGRLRWVKASDQARERITLHECRHTYASLMIAAGVNAKALSTYMGHANIGITLDLYGHMFPGNEDEAAGLLDAYLERAVGE